MVVRCPSGSSVKLEAIRGALDATYPDQEFEIQGLPVELQDRDDLEVNAQPEGADETTYYARLRLLEMSKQYGPTTGVDIAIESGAIEDQDVACIVLCNAVGNIAVGLSEGIPFPEYSLDEARKRGFKSTTAGDIVHEMYPAIPANSWQEHFPPFITRQQQIQDAIVQILRRAPEFLNHAD